MIREYLVWTTRDLTLHTGRRAEKGGTVLDTSFDVARILFYTLNRTSSQFTWLLILRAKMKF